MFEGWLFFILFCVVTHPKDSGISRHYKSWEHHRYDWIIYTSALTLPAPIHHTKKKVMKSPPLQPSLTNLKRHFQEPFSLRQSRNKQVLTLPLTVRQPHNWHALTQSCTHSFSTFLTERYKRASCICSLSHASIHISSLSVTQIHNHKRILG